MNNQLLAGLAFVGGAALGAFGGYHLAVTRLNEKYNAQMEQEIERTKKFYAHVSKADFESPSEAAEALGVTGDEALINAAEALRGYQGAGKGYVVQADHVTITKDGAVVDLDSLDEESSDENERLAKKVADAIEADHRIVESNIFQLEEENIDTSGRTPDVPYQITQIEWLANDPEHDQVSITWYAGDNQLADEGDRIITDHRIVGKHNLERFGTGRDPNIVQVRNEKLRVDYEILRHDGKYEHAVAGFAHSDETFERRGPRRRSADE